MKNPEHDEIGSRHPEAPEELERFAFLIGRWKGAGRSLEADGSWSDYDMSWIGRYVMGGHAIADETRAFDADGGLLSHFITYRFYDREAGRWHIEAFNVQQSTTVRQAPDGVIEAREGSIALTTRWEEALGREVFLDIDADRFTYRLDVSQDEGKSWNEGLDVIEARRIEAS